MGVIFVRIGRGKSVCGEAATIFKNAMRNNSLAADAYRRPILLWVLSFALAIIFVTFQIQSSIHSGALSLPPTYDDVGYFNDALQRLDLLYRTGAAAMFKNLWSNAPHAPLSTVLAMLGFCLMGRHPWAADAMNALPLALVLRLMLGTACRMLPLSCGLPLVSAFLGFPIFGLLILEFRPDMLCAIFAAAGTVIVVADPRWRAGECRTWLISTALFVGAMLAKPTLAPVTIFVFAIAVVAVTTLHARTRQNVRSMSSVALKSGGLGLILVLPYYASAFSHIYEYIHTNAFGSQASVWALKLSVQDHLLYYLVGPGGSAAIGRAWLLLSVALVLGALPLLRHQWRTVLGVGSVGIAAYASVTIPAMKSPFIGLIVPAFMLAVVFVGTLVIASRLERHAAVTASTALLAISMLTWTPVSMRLWNLTISSTQSENYQRIFTETVNAIATVPELAKRTLYFPVIAQYLNQDNVEFELRRRNLDTPMAALVYLNGDINFQRKELAKSDLVVLFSHDSSLPLPWPASSGIRKEITAAVAQAGAFDTIAEIDGGTRYPGKVWVLRRKGS